MWALRVFCFFIFFFFNDTATTEIYTLSLHDALPISAAAIGSTLCLYSGCLAPWLRSEEHTSELQSRFDLVCRLLLEKKNYFVYVLKYCIVWDEFSSYVPYFFLC